MIAGNAVRTIPSAILKKIRRGSLGSLPHAKFHHYRCILIVGPSPQKSSKLEIFGYKFVPEGRIALSDFFYTKFGKREGIPGPHPHAEFDRCGFRNVGLPPTKTSNWHTEIKGYTT